MITSNKQLQISVWITAILLVVGILIYIFTAFADKKSDANQEEKPPIRVLYNTPSGKVLFDHKAHTSETKYGLSCIDCHHHPEDEEEAIRSCNDCHVYPNKETTVNPTCLDCHEEDEVEGVETNNQVHPAHSRGECIKCHREFGKGPVDCNTCHFK